MLIKASDSKIEKDTSCKDHVNKTNEDNINVTCSSKHQLTIPTNEDNINVTCSSKHQLTIPSNDDEICPNNTEAITASPLKNDDICPMPEIEEFAITSKQKIVYLNVNPVKDDTKKMMHLEK